MDGADVERWLCNTLWMLDGAPLRAPASGSIDRPSPDVYLPTKDIAIELKATSQDKAYYDASEVKALVEWSRRADAAPRLGARFSRDSRVYLVDPVSARKTDSGSRVVDHAEAEQRSSEVVCGVKADAGDGDVDWRRS